MEEREVEVTKGEENRQVYKKTITGGAAGSAALLLLYTAAQKF
uniref:Uncharacterized protein n=1 Tax=Physcomitrium patens TaxID=3218 RepID=A0A2K1JLT9_PHYPA|nr:hypothetical protein PHYPA_017340 [Physcomitrium patens]